MPEYFFHIRLDTSPGEPKGNHRTQRTNIFATPPILAGGDTTTHQNYRNYSERADRADSDSDDWRSGHIMVESLDMVSAHSDVSASGATANGTSTPVSTSASLTKRLANSPGNAATKARFEPTNVHESDAGWGVVRVFRDTEETPGLYDIQSSHHISKPPSYSHQAVSLNTPASHPTASTSTSPRASNGRPPVKDEDCTTLAILAVPSYMSPADLLGWVGPSTRSAVSHFRLIKTERANRYMVLMRFRSGRRAREWRHEWNGATFDAAQSETAQVVFVKSIEYMSEQGTHASTSFPDIDDPFTSKTSDGKAAAPSISQSSTTAAATLKAKPHAPPTPNLVEMPTCPVCLERMDESTGLLTIQCQHVFHCTCLHKWRGSGCPVCRFTHDGLSGRRNLHASAGDDPDSGPNECSICRSDSNLWICLICGNIGCGRYDAAHAFMHWQQSGHAFSMDMSTQRIWDYNSDAYVHRIVQNKLDGKLREAPDGQGKEGAEGEGFDDSEGYVPREKSDAIGREYTALLSSQLESQRAYYEEKVSMAADKASEASLAATQAAEAASKALDELARLSESYRVLIEDKIPPLERECERMTRKADKAQEMARKFEKEWREEKAISEGLLERNKILEERVTSAYRTLEEGHKETLELRETVRDLTAYLSGQAQIKQLEKEMGEEEGIVEGTVSLPVAKKKTARKGKKGKGKEKEKESATEG